MVRRGKNYSLRNLVYALNMERSRLLTRLIQLRSYKSDKGAIHWGRVGFIEAKHRHLNIFCAL